MSKVNETITKILIERVEARRNAGETVVPPWRMTWDPALGSPRNIVSGKAYRGLNVFLTLFQGYSSPFWITAKQVKKLGGSIKRVNTGEMDENGIEISKPETYTPITFWSFPTPEEREAGKFAFMRFYKVWNVAQCEGLEEHVKKAQSAFTVKDVNPIESAEAIASGYKGPAVDHGGGRACYAPARDLVSMPVMEAFESAEAYYHTLFHELAHSTGHSSRLARDGVVNPITFASHEYSEEELVAEMCASMLAGHAGISTERLEENSAAYLDHWLSKLKSNPDWLSRAGGQAQKASDRVRGISWGKADV